MPVQLAQQSNRGMLLAVGALAIGGVILLTRKPPKPPNQVTPGGSVGSIIVSQSPGMSQIAKQPGETVAVDTTVTLSTTDPSGTPTNWPYRVDTTLVDNLGNDVSVVTAITAILQPGTQVIPTASQLIPTGATPGESYTVRVDLWAAASDSEGIPESGAQSVLLDSVFSEVITVSAPAITINWLFAPPEFMTVPQTVALEVEVIPNSFNFDVEWFWDPGISGNPAQYQQQQFAPTAFGPITLFTFLGPDGVAGAVRAIIFDANGNILAQAVAVVQ